MLLEQAFDLPDSGVDLALQPVDLLQLVKINCHHSVSLRRADT